MPQKLDFLQTAFYKGVLTPRMRGRLDLDVYFNGCEILENFIVLSQGGVFRRSGTRFVSEVKNSALNTRLIDFVPSNTEAYILELGDLYMRFFTKEAPMTALDTDAAITNETFDSSITGWTDASSGTGTMTWSGALGGTMKLAGGGAGNEARGQQTVAIGAAFRNQPHYIGFQILRDNTVGTSRPRFETVRVTIAGATNTTIRDLRPGNYLLRHDPAGDVNFTITFETLFSSHFIDNVHVFDNEPLEIPTPWEDSDINSLRKAQSVDIMYFGHHNIFPRELLRLGVDQWGLREHDFQDGPYDDINVTTTTLQAAGAGPGLVTITASSTDGINNNTGFQTTDIGRSIRIKNRSGGGWAWGEIIAINSTTQITMFNRGDAMVLTATVDWRLGSWYENNWPHKMTIHEERLCWSHNVQSPQRLWASESANFESHAPNNPVDEVVADNHALNLFPASSKLQAINWLHSTELGLLLGGASSNIVIEPASTSKGLTPDNVRRTVYPSWGAGDFEAELVDKSVIYASRDLKTLIASSTESVFSSIESERISLFAEHLFRVGIKELAYLQVPEPLLWIVMNDGSLAALTIDANQKLLAFHAHPVGGTDVVVKSIAPSTFLNEDQVWLIVQRTINGTTKQYIEFIETPFDDTDSIEAFFVDCGISQFLAGQNNLITNGTFDTDLSSWTLGGTTAPSWNADGNPGGSLEFPETTGVSHADQSFSTVPGSTLTIKFDERWISGSPNFSEWAIKIGTTQGADDVANFLYTVGTGTWDPWEFKVVVPSATTTLWIRLWKDSNGHIPTNGIVRLDNVRVLDESTVQTLDHLEGETVDILADGATHPQLTVSGGQVVLNRAADRVHIGLPMKARLKLMPLNSTSQDGGSVGKIKRAHHAHIRFDTTNSAKVGMSETTLETVLFRAAGAPMNEPTPLFTGVKTFPITGSHQEDLNLWIVGDQPLPMTVLNALIELSVHT